jgi:hypothetical protein
MAYVDQRPASLTLMDYTAASQCAVAEVDEDCWLGRLARHLLPSQHRGSPLRRCRSFGLLSTPSLVCFPGRVAGVVCCLLFKLPGGLLFGRHELFASRLHSSKLDRDV